MSDFLQTNHKPSAPTSKTNQLHQVKKKLLILWNQIEHSNMVKKFVNWFVYINTSCKTDLDSNDSFITHHSLYSVHIIIFACYSYDTIIYTGLLAVHVYKYMQHACDSTIISFADNEDCARRTCGLLCSFPLSKWAARNPNIKSTTTTMLQWASTEKPGSASLCTHVWCKLFAHYYNVILY